MRPHQDQSRVAPPAKCWKPRSLSTGLPTPVLQIRHQQQIAAARGALDAIFAKRHFHLDSSHLHGRRHLRLDGELHQLDRLPHSRCTTSLRHSALQLLAARAAASDWGWEAARGSLCSEERRRGAHRTCSAAAAVQTALGALVHVAGVLLSCRTPSNCFSQLLVLLLLILSCLKNPNCLSSSCCSTLYAGCHLFWIW